MATADLKLDTITCPKCGEVIPVSEAISHQVVEKARAQIRAEAVEQERVLAKREEDLVVREENLDNAVAERVSAAKEKLAKQAEKVAREGVATEIEELRRQAQEKEQQLKAAQEAELALRKQKRALEDRERGIELEISRRLDEERGRGEARLEEALRAKEAMEREIAAREVELEKLLKEGIEAARAEEASKAQQAAQNAVAVEVEDLRRKSEEQSRLLKEAQDAELDLRQQKWLLEERQKALSLEVARRLEEEVGKVERSTVQRLEEEHRLQDAEKDKKLQDAQRNIEELRRRLQQGSQQTQGEVLELELEGLLASTFPFDAISPVPKGVTGADVVQKVISPSGHDCGTIVWEAKRTKNWSDGWVQKLKDDQRTLKAELAVIVSEALPKDCRHFSQINGVWVANPQCALSLATALRIQLIQVAVTKLAGVGKNEKMELLYSYLSGAEFRQRVETIVEAFGEMQKDLAEERKVAERRWAKREKQLLRVIGSTSGMYGDLQGLIGSSLQTIPALLEGVSDEIDDGKGSSPEALLTSGRQVSMVGDSGLCEPGHAEVMENEEESFSLGDYNRARAADRRDL